MEGLMSVVLAGPDTMRERMSRLYRGLVDLVAAGQVIEVVAREPKRSLPQNAMLHAMLTEVSQRVKWANEYRDVTTWKRLMVAAWLRANGEHPQVLPSIDGAGIEVIYEPTSSMSKRQLNSLIEFVQAWMAEHVPEEAVC
jgi:hypothetical protein